MMRRLVLVLAAATVVFGCAAVVSGQTEVPQIPREMQKELNGLVGSWKLEGKFGDEPFEAVWSARWAPNRSYLVTTLVVEEDGKTERHIGLIGWDPVSEEFVDVHFSLGGPVIGRSKVTSPGVWEGGYDAVYQGKRVKNRCKFAFENDDRIVLTTKGEGGLPDEIYEFTRLAKKPPVRRQKRGEE